MKCLIIVPSLVRAGAETQAVDLANGLASRGHVVHLASFQNQLDQRARIHESVRFHHVLRMSRYDTSLIRRLAQIIDEEKIDIIQGVLQFATLIAWLAARQSRRKPPVVAAVHTTINRSLKLELHDRILYRRLLRRLPAVVFVCEHQKTHWIRKYPELGPLARVVPNGIDPQRFCRHDFIGMTQPVRADYRIPKDAFVFLCIAAFRPEKGHALLIDSFAEVTGEPYLLLAGDGPYKHSIETKVAEQGLTPRVRFLGSLADIRPVIVASNATILASTAETFSMAMLESMALGVPMLAPQIGGLSEAIADKKTGWLVPVGDKRALSLAMQKLVNDRAVVLAAGERAAETVRSNFTLQRMIDSAERVLTEVCDSAQLVHECNEGDTRRSP
jgi:glycosyltransferase involved in cell wall biosynthesis